MAGSRRQSCGSTWRGEATLKIIYDTDIGWMNDDCIAAILALHAPGLELVGITPVMGNYDLALEVACALRLTELSGREDVPVAAGFDRPLLHERDAYAGRMWGQWATFRSDFDIPPGLPGRAPDPRHAVDFIIDSVRAAPGEITILAVGPLTNLAVAIRKAPDIVKLIPSVVIMGGGLAMLPGGWGNSTPLAEFNFWVDPEAARMVMRSGLAITLVPINLCRQTHLPLAMVERLAGAAGARTGVAELFGRYTLPLFAAAGDSLERQNHLAYGLYDSCVVAYALRPELFETMTLAVDVATTPGPEYGMSVGWRPGERVVDDENITFPVPSPPGLCTVVTRVDFAGLVALYLEAVGA
jgi:inosine-uridine nucleoside N-ribohydrolase